MDLMTRRRALLARVESGGGRLPAGYQEVEWIQSSKTQYIDTGIVPSNTFGVHVILARTVLNESMPISGSYKGNIWGMYLYAEKCTSAYDGRLACAYGNRNIFIGPQLLTTDMYEFYISIDPTNGLHVRTPQTDYGYYQFSSIENNATYFLFGANYSGQFDPNRAGNIKMQYFEIEKDGNSVREFIPCYRKSDSKPGMYDLVSKTFFTNSGTGEFTVGPDIN